MEKLVATQEFIDFIKFYSNLLCMIPFHSNFMREVEEQMDLREFLEVVKAKISISNTLYLSIRVQNSWGFWHFGRVKWFNDKISYLIFASMGIHVKWRHHGLKLTQEGGFNSVEG
ncbi:unnamed protein product [Prunus armeniaca]|uniref:Uncharacterized protein n=1 Tax=Prunus armeniaca TaxID=36596 RepID=A0A6J5V6H2_PRUAR|nr:unnamed protein product [Prunus armeniaca]